LRGLGLAAIVIIIIGIIGVLFFHQGGISLASRPTQTQEIIEALPELPTATLFIGLVSVENTPTQMELPPTETPSPTAEPPTPTQTTSPTIPVPTEGPDMGTPFGPSLEFTLHTVQPSEALSAIARTYNTSVEVIRASNVLIEGASVWPGKVLVIIPGETDPTKTIKFCVMRLSVPITVEQLAQLQRISVDDIRFYNVLGPDETIPAHRWLIFPSENILDPKQCQ
jgi:LysM repeat protein